MREQLSTANHSLPPHKLLPRRQKVSSHWRDGSCPVIPRAQVKTHYGWEKERKSSFHCWRRAIKPSPYQSCRHVLTGLLPWGGDRASCPFNITKCTHHRWVISSKKGKLHHREPGTHAPILHWHQITRESKLAFPTKFVNPGHEAIGACHIMG